MLEIRKDKDSNDMSIKGDHTALNELSESIQRAMRFGSDVTDIMVQGNGTEYQIEIVVKK